MDYSYPDREPFFAHKFTRIMFKTCLCQELGTGAFALLTTIVHTEDAARYRRPVTFYNTQLMPVLGMSQSQLTLARSKCIKAGWLHYVPGGKSRAGVYWVTVPDHAMGLGDSPTDDSDVPVAEDEANERQTVDKRETNERQTEDKRETNERQTREKPSPFLPNPDPNPTPDPSPKKETAKTRSPLSRIVDEWNNLPGVCRVRPPISDSRRRAMGARLLMRGWVEALPDAFEAIRGSPFCQGENERNWRATIDWFLRPDTVTKLIEGQYAGKQPFSGIKAWLETPEKENGIPE